MTKTVDDATASADGEGPGFAWGPPVASDPVVTTLRRRDLRSWPLHEKGGAADCMPLSEALMTRWDSDRYVVAYAAPTIDGIPRRLSHEALAPTHMATIGVVIVMTLLVVEVDCPGKKKGPEVVEAWWPAERVKVMALLVVQPGLVCFRTRGGYRILGRLERSFEIRGPEDVAVWHALYLSVLDHLLATYAIEGDTQCSDWTRLQGLPFATREGSSAPEDRETIGDPESVATWNLVFLSPALLVAKAKLARVMARFVHDGDEEDAREFAPASPALLEHARTLLDAHGPAIDREHGGFGGADQHTLEVGMILLNDLALDEDEAMELALAWNETCLPKWDEDELRLKIANGRYAQGVRGSKRLEFGLCKGLGITPLRDRLPNVKKHIVETVAQPISTPAEISTLSAPPPPPLRGPVFTTMSSLEGEAEFKAAALQVPPAGYFDGSEIGPLDAATLDLIVPKKSKVARDDGSSPRGEAFRNGSEVEFGRRLVEDIKLDLANGIAPVYSMGDVYAYDVTCGLWAIVEQSTLRTMIHRYDGLKYENQKGERVPIKLSNNAIKGGVSITCDSITDRTFFENAPAGFAFANGFAVVSKEGIELRAHSSENRAIIGVTYDYNPDAGCSRWMRFLDEILIDPSSIEERMYDVNNEQDVERCRSLRAARIVDGRAKGSLLQEFIGACLIGRATQMSQCVVLSGEGDNGKSKIIDTLTALFPHNAVEAIAPQDFSNEYRKAALAHVMLNAVSELPEREILYSESFKAIVSGDETSGRQIYKPPFKFRPRAGHLFGANALPGTSDQSWGFWRRFIVLEFNRRFCDTHEVPSGSFVDVDSVFQIKDRNLLDALRSEIPGIMAWALRGAVRVLQNSRYTEVPSSQRAIEQWRLRADAVREFTTYHCELTSERKEFAEPTALFQAFRKFCEETGHKWGANMSLNKFGQRLKQIGFEQTQVDKKRCYPLKLRKTSGSGSNSWRR